MGAPQLIDPMAGRIAGWLTRTLTIDVEDAESIAAEVVWQHGDSPGMVATIARRRAIEHVRRWRGEVTEHGVRHGLRPEPVRVACSSHPDDWRTWDLLCGGGEDPGYEAVDEADRIRWLRTQIEALLSRLSDIDARRLRAVYLEGVPIAELAEREGVSRNAIDVHLVQARRRARAVALGRGERTLVVVPDAPVPADCPLTDSERTMLAALADGATEAVAAVAADISFGAVHGRIQRMRREQGAKSTTHLVAIALRKGWIS